jgi:hypothetical protein
VRRRRGNGRNGIVTFGSTKFSNEGHSLRHVGFTPMRLGKVVALSDQDGPSFYVVLEGAMAAVRQFSPHYDDVLRDVSSRIDASGSIGKVDIAALAFWKRIRTNSWSLNCANALVRDSSPLTVGDHSRPLRLVAIRSVVHVGGTRPRYQRPRDMTSRAAQDTEGSQFSTFAILSHIHRVLSGNGEGDRMIRKLGSVLLVILAVCLLATSTAQASAKATVIYTSANFAKGTERPAGPISGYVAVPVALDGATTLRPAWLPIVLRSVHWSSWGGMTATGSGTLYAPTVTYGASDDAFVTPCASFTSSNVCVLPKGYTLPKVGRTTVTAQALLTHNGQRFYDELNVVMPPYPNGEPDGGGGCVFDWVYPWIYTGTVDNYEASPVAGATIWTVGPSTVCP